MADGGTPTETGQRGDDADTQSAIRAEGHETQNGVAEAGPADFRLERALRPADETGCHVAEENVADGVVQIRHADPEEKLPAQDGFRGAAGRAGLCGAEDLDGGEEEGGDGEGEREVRKGEGEERGHLFGVARKRGGGELWVDVCGTNAAAAFPGDESNGATGGARAASGGNSGSEMSGVVR